MFVRFARLMWESWKRDVVGGRNFPEFCLPHEHAAPKRRARNSPAARAIARGHGRRSASGGRTNGEGWSNDAVSGLSDTFRPSTSLSNAFPTSVRVAVTACSLVSTSRTRWRVRILAFVTFYEKVREDPHLWSSATQYKNRLPRT